ncbi:MAG: phage portal protein [Anaerolineae bacterium]
MILTELLSGKPKVVVDSKVTPTADYPPRWGYTSEAGESVTVESSKTIATAYRAKNIISDDVAKMPFQVMRRDGRRVAQVEPDAVTRNIAYLLQVSPNLWGWTTFDMMKKATEWLLFYGNSYIWRPVKGPQQLLLLAANRTYPVFDLEGNLWYRHTFYSGETVFLPDVEVLHRLINPDETGFMGRGVITYARETLGRQLTARKAQSKLWKQGVLPAAIIQMQGELDKDGRAAVRRAYEEAMSGADNAYRLAVMDAKVAKFDPISMPLKDAQFLESIDATDTDICNFFGIPEHMLNRGKQAYNSNEQKYLEYLQGTLDSYLVGWEQAARIRWLSREEQGNTYFRFVREALLRMDAKSRAEMFRTRIESGQMRPNEAREKEDMPAYKGGDKLYMASNIAGIEGSEEEG